MQSPTARRRGFTLVELLVVIAIVGILASLITVAASSAITSAKQTRIKAELDQIAAAFKAYKVEYGSYPPNFANDGENSAVRQHLLKAFPRIDGAELTKIKTLTLNPAQAVVFWLHGYSSDPRLPLSGPGGPLGSSSTKATPLFEFDEMRVKDTGGVITYTPPGTNLSEPYVYFDVSRLNPSDTGPSYSSTEGNGTARPYKSTSGRYVDGEAFQVLAAGLDNHWGTASKPEFPGGPFLGPDADNLASFSTKNMEDSMP